MKSTFLLETNCSQIMILKTELQVGGAHTVKLSFFFDAYGKTFYYELITGQLCHYYYVYMIPDFSVVVGAFFSRRPKGGCVQAMAKTG